MLYRRLPFFYGWVIVGVSMVSSSLMSGLGIWAMSVFIVPMEAELGWSRTTIFLAFTIRALMVGVLAPIVGPLLDRKHGPRVALLVAGLAMGGSLAYTGRVHSVLEYQLVYGVVGAMGMLGTGMTMTHVVLPKWFVRKRGRAIAFAMAGAGSGPLLYPIIVGTLITAVGWRDAWLYLGIFAAAVLVPASLLVYRSPEDVGAQPDGRAAPRVTTGSGPRPAVIDEQSFTVHQMLGTRAFWLIMLAFSMASLAPGGFQVQWVPHFQSLGFTLSLATTAIMVYAVVSIPGRFVWGMIAERAPLRYVYAAQAALTAFACFSFLVIPNTPMLLLAAALMGIGMGGFFIIQPLMLPDYFGRRNLGSIVGISRPFITLAAAIGPLLVAFIYDTFDSYTWSFVAIGIAWGVSAVASYFAVPPAGVRPTALTLGKG